MKKLIHLFSSSNEGNKLSKGSNQNNDQTPTRTPWKGDSTNFSDGGHRNSSPKASRATINRRESRIHKRHESTDSMKYADRTTSFGQNPPRYEETQRGRPRQHNRQSQRFSTTASTFGQFKALPPTPLELNHEEGHVWPVQERSQQSSDAIFASDAFEFPEQRQPSPTLQSTSPLAPKFIGEKARQKSPHKPSQQYSQISSAYYGAANRVRGLPMPSMPSSRDWPMPDQQRSRKSSRSESTFWEPGSTQSLPRFNPQDILIAVMGMTGAGKTSFISKIAEIDMKIGHGLSSCTKEVGIATMEHQGRRIHFIDTPGFDDTDLKDADILEVIALYLTNTQSRRVRLSGILYLHRITDPRVGGTAIKNIRLFRGLVGNRSMGNVALVTTMWGLVSAQEGAARMDELARTDNFWGSMIGSGATCDKYDGTRRDGLRIINMLLQKTPCILQIQEEMEGGAKLTETTAGKEVNDRIAEIEARYKKEIDDLRSEMKQVQDARELEKLLQEQEAARAKMEEAQRAKERLLEATIEQQAAQIHELQNGGGCVIL